MVWVTNDKNRVRKLEEIMKPSKNKVYITDGWNPALERLKESEPNSVFIVDDIPNFFDIENDKK